MELRLIKTEEFNEQAQSMTLAALADERRAFLLARSEAVQRESLAGEWLAKTMLSKTTGIPFEKLVLARDERGKPFPVGVEMFFSISHSHGVVACAVDRVPIGLDIERLRPLNEKLIKRICSPTEESFVGFPAVGWEERLLRVWTAKEAYFKHQGGGMDLLASEYQDLCPRLTEMQKLGCVVSVYK